MQRWAEAKRAQVPCVSSMEHRFDWSRVSRSRGTRQSPSTDFFASLRRGCRLGIQPVSGRSAMVSPHFVEIELSSWTRSR